MCDPLLGPARAEIRFPGAKQLISFELGLKMNSFKQRFASACGALRKHSLPFERISDACRELVKMELLSTKEVHIC